MFFLTQKKYTVKIDEGTRILTEEKNINKHEGSIISIPTQSFNKPEFLNLNSLKSSSFQTIFICIALSSVMNNLQEIFNES
tara:strand:- start:15260 stop:15502 length:243 start_codon:yes stop_codon:yes gene_type:complete